MGHWFAYRLASPGSNCTLLTRRFVKYLLVPRNKLLVKTSDSLAIAFVPPVKSNKNEEAYYGTDWLPGPRTEILAMCRKWIAYLIEALRIALEIPGAEFTELGKLFTAPETLLVKAQDEVERTHVITVECQAAFKALSAKMRFFRDRYFKIPPLSEGDWAALGFRQKDTHPSPVPAPDGVLAVSLSYPGDPHAITVHLEAMFGTQELDPAGDYGYAIYVGIMPPGGATLEQAASEKHYLMKPPIDGKGLVHLRFTRRKKENLLFDAEDGGMTVYIGVHDRSA